MFDLQQIKRARLYVALSVLLGMFDMLFLLCGMGNNDGGIVTLALVVLAVEVCLVVRVVQRFPALYFGYRIERDFKLACRGLRLTSMSGLTAKAVLRYGILGIHQGKLANDEVAPKIIDLHGDFDQFRAEFVPLYGQSVDTFTKQADSFAMAFQVSVVRFERGASGRSIIVSAGRPVMPDKLPLAQSPLARPVTPVDDDAPVDMLSAVPVAYTPDGERVHLPVKGQHILIAGRTGAGKSSWIWAIILGLAPAYRDGLVVFWGIDPKRIELGIEKRWFEHYADTQEAIIETLELAVSEMFARTSRMQGVSRSFTPSRDNPLNVVIIDELAYVAAMLPDKKLRERAEKALVTLLSQGRAVGYVCIGCVQDPRKEVVGFRDLFPFRIALALPKPMVDLILGDGMWEAGAYCEQIPLDGAGSGYIVDDSTYVPLLCRAPFIEDAAISAAWRDHQPMQQPLPAPTQAVGSIGEQTGGEDLSYRVGYRSE